MNIPHRRSGYTLTEILIVLAVIALLLAVLLPTLSMAKGRARQQVCADNLRQLHLAFAMYAGDHDGFLPPFSNDISYIDDNLPETAKHKKHYPPSNLLLTSVLAPYVHSNTVWFCPDDTLARQNTLAMLRPPGLKIDHWYGSYETGWWMGLIKYPARIDGIPMTDTHGKTMDMNLAEQGLLFDEEIQKTGCGDWLYSHHDQFNRLFLDGHTDSVAIDCAE